MARKRKSGGRRKGIQVTPLRVAKALTVIAGAKMILDSDVINLAKTHISGGAGGVKAAFSVAGAKEYASRIIPGALVITVGPKIEEKFVQLISKGEPALGRVARVKLITV